jgi:transcriptional regulator with XRE-family HTH domain
MAVWLDEPLSISMVQKWEQGQRPINPSMAIEIANYYKVEPKIIVERRHERI